MNYSDFMEFAAKHIKDYLPPEYADANVRLDSVQKTSEQYTGLTVRLDDKNSAPVVNMKQFYEVYEQEGNLEGIMQEMATVVQMEPPAEIDMDVMENYEQVKDKLFIRLAPSEGNEEIMAASPHKLVEDMLMTYNIYIPDHNGGFMAARISNEIMAKYGITQEQLHADAVLSTGKIFEPKILGMMEALTGLVEDDPQMMIVTNRQGMLGASALFCEGILDQAAEMMKGNYFVLPSSCHEFIIVPDNGDFNRSNLEKMVKEANETVVEAADRLSDHVYHYDSKDRIFERAEKFEARTQEKSAERGSLLGKLQDKKEQIERNAPVIGQNKQRQAGLAI